MSEIDERLAKIHGRDWAALKPDEWEQYASIDLRYLLDLVADLRHQLEDLQSALTQRDVELIMLREALDTIPLHEYGEAQHEGCDAKGAWDCFKEALAEHIATARSASVVYETAADLCHQLATVTALVPEADWLEMFMAVTRIEDDCTHCPYREDGKDGCEFPCNDVHDMARALAAAIRDWREEQGQEAEE